RIYYERAHAHYEGAPPEPSATPTALAVFPHDNFIPLRHIAEQTNPIVRWTEYDRGGHFAAMEQPDLLVTDIREFFRQLREAPADGARQFTGSTAGDHRCPDPSPPTGRRRRIPTGHCHSNLTSYRAVRRLLARPLPADSPVRGSRSVPRVAGRYAG